MDYRNKKILAPMVRAGTLPFRQLARSYGADLVYSEELIDKKLVKCERTVNETLGLVEFRCNGALVFATPPSETSVVCQIGTADATTALAAATVVANDVAAIDINMGCPKRFSVHCGMGAALLTKPQTVKEILSTLVRNLSLPVTCKIRLLDTTVATLDLIRTIEQTGVSALAIHARQIPERPRDPAHWDELALLTPGRTVPIIANGDIYTPEDIVKVREQTGVDSVMIARGALKNPAIFSDGPMPDLHDCIREYLKLSCDCSNIYQNTKWAIGEMLDLNGLQKGEHSLKLQSARSLRELCAIWDVEDHYSDTLERLGMKELGGGAGKRKRAASVAIAQGGKARPEAIGSHEEDHGGQQQQLGAHLERGAQASGEACGSVARAEE